MRKLKIAKKYNILNILDSKIAFMLFISCIFRIRIINPRAQNGIRFLKLVMQLKFAKFFTAHDIFTINTKYLILEIS